MLGAIAAVNAALNYFLTSKKQEDTTGTNICDLPTYHDYIKQKEQVNRPPEEPE